MDDCNAEVKTLEVHFSSSEFSNLAKLFIVFVDTLPKFRHCKLQDSSS